MPPRNQREPSLESLLRLVDHADLVDEQDVQRLLVVATATDNTPLRRQIERVLAAKATHRQAQPFDGDPPHVAPLANRLSLGVTITGSTYALEQDDLTQHLLAIGSGTDVAVQSADISVVTSTRQRTIRCFFYNLLICSFLYQ